MEGDALSSLSLAGVADSSVPLLPFFFLPLTKGAIFTLSRSRERAG
jgi:hypothetical protein